jgi:hypothetical protein
MNMPFDKHEDRVDLPAILVTVNWVWLVLLSLVSLYTLLTVPAARVPSLVGQCMPYLALIFTIIASKQQTRQLMRTALAANLLMVISVAAFAIFLSPPSVLYTLLLVLPFAPFLVNAYYLFLICRKG